VSLSSVSPWYLFFPVCSADRAGKGCGIKPASYIAGDILEMPPGFGTMRSESGGIRDVSA